MHSRSSTPARSSYVDRSTETQGPGNGVLFFCFYPLTLVSTHCYTLPMTKTTTPAQTVRCVCGRKLTAARSIARGVGPVCAKKIAAKAEITMAKHKPEQVSKAVELIGDGAIVRISAGTFAVVSSNGVDRYTATSITCTCPAGTYGRTCYHRVAAELIAA